MGELVMRCFHARTAAHVFHLGTHSYAQHVALQEFYEGILGFADELAEVKQGDDLELLKLTGVPYRAFTDPLEMVTDLGDWVSDNREDCCDAEDTCLQNIIDEIMALICKTKYKLKFLK